MANIKFVVIFASILTQSVLCEPACSRFAYEEQLLEKMVRTEWKMERMQDAIKKIQADVDNKINEFNERIDSMVTVCDIIGKNISDIAVDVEHAKTEIKEIMSKDVPEKRVVAFSAANLKDTSLTVGQHMIFNEVNFNEGGGYNAETGVFTAPLGGFYTFSAHLCNRAGKEAAYAIVLDGNELIRSVQSDNDFYSCNSVMVNTKVPSGGKVWLECTYSYGSDVNQFHQNPYRRLMFEGVLLYPN